MKNKRFILHIDYEWILLVAMFLQVFLMQWLNLTYYYLVIIDFLVVGYLVLHWKKIHKMGMSIIPFLCFVIYFLFNLLRPNCRWKVLLLNFHQLVTPLLIVIGVSSLWCNRNRIEQHLARAFFVINFYMFINVGVLILQLQNHFELSGRHPSMYINTYKPDLISGLFGYNGTPMLAAFSSFFFVYNLWYYRNYLKKNKRIIFFIYYFSMLGFYLFISVPNDNKGFFLELILFYVIYYLNLHDNYKRVIQKIKSGIKGFILSISVIIAIIITYNNYSPFQKLVDKMFMIFESSANMNYVAGSAERFGIINYFFRENINKLIGVGIGTIKWKENLGFGFFHFGQNDLGPFLLLGGLVLVLLILMVYINSITCITSSIFIIVLDCLLLLVLLVYTQALTSLSIIISIMLFLVLCGFEKKEV